MDTLQRSIDKNVSGALMLMRSAEAAGDGLRVELAGAILRECGYPGGEGCRSVADITAAIAERDDAATT